MRIKTVLLTIAVSGTLFTSCQQQSVTPDSQPTLSSARKGMEMNYTAHLTSEQEVGMVQSRAQGQGILRFNKEGTELYYKLIVSNLTSVVGAHLHLGVAGQNGPVVVNLLMGQRMGKVNGVLAEGTITATNLVGPLAGMTLDQLRMALEEGKIYFNVHTKAYPGGEIRGQVYSK